MTYVTVFRHIPPPIIGMVGTRYHPQFRQFESTLDWLETTGVLVERFDPAIAATEIACRPAVQPLLSEPGGRCLPLILVNDEIASQGVYPSRAQLARLVGQAKRRQRSAA